MKKQYEETEIDITQYYYNYYSTRMKRVHLTLFHAFPMYVLYVSYTVVGTRGSCRNLLLLVPSAVAFFLFSSFVGVHDLYLGRKKNIYFS